MSSYRYIEIDSTYRNRKLWPKESDFDVILSQTGRADATNASDPVANSMPVHTWTSNRFTANAYNSTINVTVDLGTTPLGYTSVKGTFIVVGTPGELQQQLSYYNNATIDNLTNPNQETRIISYEYIGNDRALITVESEFGTLNNGDTLQIRDPTDLSSISSPWFFVPYIVNNYRATNINDQGGDNRFYDMLLYNETRNEYRKITNFNINTHMLTTQTSIPISWTVTDNYSIRKEVPVLLTVAADPAALPPPIPSPPVNSLNTILFNTPFNTNYNYAFIRVRPSIYGTYTLVPPEDEIRQIVQYSYDNNYNVSVASVSPSFSAIITPGTVVEILPFSYDNFNPLVYTGSTVSQQEMVCYEIELINLVLPNWTMKNSFGSIIAYYPYVYVEFTNLSAAKSGMNNILYSNNPNSTKMLFRAPIDDTQHPSSIPFIKIDGDGAVQTIKFKPNDNFHFSVRLPNGELFQTILPEYYSPSSPNYLTQISALFAIKRI